MEHCFTLPVISIQITNALLHDYTDDVIGKLFKTTLPT